LSKIHGVLDEYLDEAHRTFRVEVLRGGMNRLLFRSNRTNVLSTRIEILFMNVKYLSVATQLIGPQIRRVGDLREHADLVPWTVESAGLSIYSIRCVEGEGLLVAGSLSVEVSEASATDPSDFFMMD